MLTTVYPMHPLASAHSAARGPCSLQRHRHLRVGQRGLGLVELLIASAIGLFLLAGLTDFLGRSLTQSGRDFQDARLTQDLNVAMELMTRDLRRAGYSSAAQGATSAAGAAANPFMQANGGIVLGTVPPCVLYSYDLPGSENGALDGAENLGFRLQSNAVQAGTGVTSCTAGNWQPVTDPTLSTITALSFQYLEGPATVAFQDLDGPDAVADPQQPYAAATGPNWAVCTRLIRITLTGNLVGNPTVTRTLTQTVRVRNDWYRTGTTTCA